MTARFVTLLVTGVLSGPSHAGVPTLTILPMPAQSQIGVSPSPANNPLSLVKDWGHNIIQECTVRGYTSNLRDFPPDGAVNRTCTDDVWFAKCFLARQLSNIADCRQLLSENQNLCQVWPETIQNYCCETDATSSDSCRKPDTVVGMGAKPWSKGLAQLYLPRGLRKLSAETEELAELRDLRRRGSSAAQGDAKRSADISIGGLTIHVERGNAPTEAVQLITSAATAEQLPGSLRWDDYLAVRELDEPVLELSTMFDAAATSVARSQSDEDLPAEHRLQTNAVILFPSNLKLCSLLISVWKTMRLVASLYDVRDVVANRQWAERDSESTSRFIDQFGAQVLFPTEVSATLAVEGERRLQGEPCEAGFVRVSHQVKELGYAYASGELSLEAARESLTNLIDENFTFLNGDKIVDVDYQQLKQTLRFTGFVSDAFLIAPGCWSEPLVAAAIQDESTHLTVQELIPHMNDMLDYLTERIEACEDDCLGRIWTQVETLSGITDPDEASHVQEWFLDNLRWIKSRLTKMNVDPNRTWGDLLMTFAESWILPLATSVDETQKYRANMAYKFLVALNKDVSEPVPTLGLEVHRLIRNNLRCGKGAAGPSPRLLLEEDQPLTAALRAEEEIGQRPLKAVLVEDLASPAVVDTEREEPAHESWSPDRALRRTGGFFLKRDIVLGDRVVDEPAALTAESAEEVEELEEEFPAELRQLPRKIAQGKYAELYEVARQHEQNKQSLQQASGQQVENTPSPDQIPEQIAPARGMVAEIPAAAASGPHDSIPTRSPSHDPPAPQYRPGNPNGGIDGILLDGLTYPTQLTELLSMANLSGATGLGTSALGGAHNTGAQIPNDPLANRLKPLIPIQNEERIQGFHCADKFEFLVSEFANPWLQRANCFDLISAFGCKGQRGGKIMPLQVLVNACPQTWIKGCSNKVQSMPSDRQLQTVIGASIDGMSVSGPNEESTALILNNDVFQEAALLPLRDCLRVAVRNTQEIDRDREETVMLEVLREDSVNDEFTETRETTVGAGDLTGLQAKLNHVYESLAASIPTDTPVHKRLFNAADGAHSAFLHPIFAVAAMLVFLGTNG